MRRLRELCTGEMPVHFYRKTKFLTGVALGLALGVAPVSVARAAPPPAVRATSMAVGQTVEDFYRARSNAPLWLSGSASIAPDQLIALLNTSTLDGLDPQVFHIDALQQALQKAREGKRKDIDVADRMLSDAFVSYVAQTRRDPDLGILYVDAALRPSAPSPRAALLGAANAPSLADYVRNLGWMNPLYGELRRALATNEYSNDHERQLLMLNLERARTLPPGKQRYILVNAAQQRLYTYEDGKQVDSMVVVVGKPKYPTPMMTAYVRFASLNPYWFVPTDLAAERIAPKVVKQGLKYLNDLGYKVLSDWTPNAQIVDPTTIDWKAVAAGKAEVIMRQDPGPHNSMGRMKFMFPNEAGVYLHDNPERELFTEASRLYSGGCVRLEDAPRLGRWLFGHELEWESASTEQMEPLKMPVPVYITYLTAMPDETGSSIAYYNDVYGRDAARVAKSDSSTGKVTSAAR